MKICQFQPVRGKRSGHRTVAAEQKTIRATGYNESGYDDDQSSVAKHLGGSTLLFRKNLRKIRLCRILAFINNLFAHRN